MFSFARSAQRQRLLSLRAEMQRIGGFSLAPLSIHARCSVAPLQVAAWGSGTVQIILYFWDVDKGRSFVLAETRIVLQGSEQDFVSCLRFHQLPEPEIGVYEVALHLQRVLHIAATTVS